MSAVGEVIIFHGNKSLFPSSGKGGPICHSPTSVLRFEAVLLTSALWCSDLSFFRFGYVEIVKSRTYAKWHQLTWWHVMSKADQTNIPERA